ncbi:MAG: S41 family peptidase [Clostridium sp.]
MSKNSWKDKWMEDIEYLKSTLINKHKNLFFNISRGVFENNIDNLERMIDRFDYNDMKVEISRLVASVGDAHTAVKLPMNYLLPLEFYWFKEGIYVVKALGKYKYLEYYKVIEINNIEIDEVLDELSEIISHENSSYLKANIVKYIQAIEILYGLTIVDNIESCVIKFESLNGEIITENIKSVNTINYTKLLDNYNKYMENEMPLYMKNNSRNYWFEYLEEQKIIYFKYNLCRNNFENSIGGFISKIIDCIENNNVEKLVVDLRNNTGGDSRLLEPFIEYVKANKKININGKLFVVIGRDTFSSALLNAFLFRENTNAILIGEATGGKPNCYGEIEKFILPNSKFLVTYSTEYYKLIEDDKINSLLPDINVELGIYNFINYNDPILDKIETSY